jgi:hypothetical protein
MKRKGKEYFGAPKWFLRYFGLNDSRGFMLCVGELCHYIGFGFDKRTHTWTEGYFPTDAEYNTDFWQEQAKKADFIIHIRGTV